jgi:hypothetical protein
MEEWLRSLLLGSAGVASIFGNRVDWGTRQQGAPLPGAALFLISNVPELTMSGASGWWDARVQIDSLGDRADQAILGRRAIAAAVHLTRATAGGKKYRCFVIDADSKAETDGTGVIHRARLDVRVHYQA